MAVGWPKFEPAVFVTWDSVPDEARSALLAAGVPQSFFGRRYRAVPEPVLVRVADGRHLVRFGQAMLFGSMYLDPSTGRVLQLADTPEASGHIVNGSLDQFANTIRAVIGMFPFYDGDSELEERVQVAGRIAEVIRRIDMSALDPDGFWGTFLDDVINGDFATEDVVGGA